MITDFKCNRVYLSAKMASLCPITFQKLTEVLSRHTIKWSLLEGTNDIWCRDFMPIQIDCNSYAEFRYYPDYLLRSLRYRQSITDGSELAKSLGFSLISGLKDIIIDGGNVVKCDDKVIMTSKVFEENPSYTVAQLSNKIENALGAELIVIPWDINEFFGHSDGVCRYIGNNRLLVTSYREIDKRMTDRFIKCLEPHFKEVHELNFRSKKSKSTNWAYINWLQTDRIIVMPSFDTKEDIEALDQISSYMPDYKIEMVDSRDLVVHGGGLNCCSWTTCEDIISILK